MYKVFLWQTRPFQLEFFREMIVGFTMIVFCFLLVLRSQIYSSKQQVLTKTSVTWYGSQFDDGLLSSR